MRERISPCWPRLTASGLMIAKVRSSATKDSSNKITENRRQAACSASGLEGGGDGRAEVRGSFDGAYPCSAHCRVLVLGRALSAADDRARMPHAAARRRGLAGDETDDRFFHVRFDPLSGGFFRVTADFSDQDDCVRVGIVVKEFHCIEERCADDGIAADPDAGGLPYAQTRELIDSFVGQRAAAAYHANVALLVNATGHDPNLAFAWRDDAGAVRADQTRLVKVYGGC